MFPSDSRYSRDRMRQDVALRFLQHEARTGTICRWTGLPPTKVRGLFSHYVARDRAAQGLRHRGRSPALASFFMRTPQLRLETATLASICYLHGVLTPGRIEQAELTLPGPARGAILCDAFEDYQLLVPEPQISFEHAVFLVIALAGAEQLFAVNCTECRAVFVVDHCSRADGCCEYCARETRRLASR